MSKIDKNNIYLLEDVQLYKDDNLNNTYFFKLVYTFENDSGVYRLVLPKVYIGIPYRYLDIVTENVHNMKIRSRIRFMNDDSYHALLPDEHGKVLYTELISEKVHEMTLEEIEKKLGYKVKLVSEKKEEK